MVRHHSLRKAHISIAVAVTVLIVGYVTFGHRSETAYQLLVLGSYVCLFGTLLALYRREERRRSSHTK